MAKAKKQTKPVEEKQEVKPEEPKAEQPVVEEPKAPEAAEPAPAPEIPLEKRVEKLEQVVKAILNSYNGQIKAASVGADPFPGNMATVEGFEE